MDTQLKVFCSLKNCSLFISWEVTWEDAQLDTLKEYIASFYIHKSIPVFVLQAASSHVWSCFQVLVRKCSSFFSNIFALLLFFSFYYSVFKKNLEHFNWIQKSGCVDWFNMVHFTPWKIWFPGRKGLQAFFYFS